MIGFAPGFPYLGGLDPAIACPRRETPRTHVPAGSVGIGGSQTGIYPVESPGGWQLIGRTDVVLFDPSSDPPGVLAPGDRVRFVESRA
jgi:inhibitor of KinA